MSQTAVNTNTYTRAHTAKYVSDKMRIVLKILIMHYKLDPRALVDAYTSWIDAAARELLERGDLTKIIIEFYKSGSSEAIGRWDFPIRYDGNGADEMWVDRAFLEDSFAKTSSPPPDCLYRVLLGIRDGAPLPAGTQWTACKSLNKLTGREAGTVVSTPDIMASMTYYKA